LNAAYGYRVESDNDYFVELSERALYELSRAVMPGAYLVDSFRWRETILLILEDALTHQTKVEYLPSWLPGMGFKAEACRMRHILQEFTEKPYAWAKNQIVSNLYFFRLLKLKYHIDNREGTPFSSFLCFAAAIAFKGGGAHFEMDRINLVFRWHGYCMLCSNPSMVSRLDLI
jgi:hypothetical protein